MPQPTQTLRCAVCNGPLDPETEDAHWLHEPDCPGAQGRPGQGCQCDLYVHPDCCLWCRATEPGLIDVTDMGHEAGWRWRVNLTTAAWERCVASPSAQGLQTTNERLWHVVWMARGAAIRARNGAARRVAFTAYVIQPRDRIVRPEELYLDTGPNDEGLPAITIMLAGEHQNHPPT